MIPMYPAVNSRCKTMTMISWDGVPDSSKDWLASSMSPCNSCRKNGSMSFDEFDELDELDDVLLLILTYHAVTEEVDNNILCQLT